MRLQLTDCARTVILEHEVRRVKLKSDLEMEGATLRLSKALTRNRTEIYKLLEGRKMLYMEQLESYDLFTVIQALSMKYSEVEVLQTVSAVYHPSKKVDKLADTQEAEVSPQPEPVKFELPGQGYDF